MPQDLLSSQDKKTRGTSFLCPRSVFERCLHLSRGHARGANEKAVEFTIFLTLHLSTGAASRTNEKAIEFEVFSTVLSLQSSPPSLSAPFHWRRVRDEGGRPLSYNFLHCRWWTKAFLLLDRGWNFADMYAPIAAELRFVGCDGYR